MDDTAYKLLIFFSHLSFLTCSSATKTSQRDAIEPPTTIFPTIPPATIPYANPTPTNPVTTPVINPIDPPSTIPSSTPIFNPVTTYPYPPPGVATPIQSPAVLGQTWCVARTEALESALQAGLDYACGVGGVDCSAIQQTGSCYTLNTLQTHASYAFNSYYQKNLVNPNCDFGGTAILVNNNPSTESCIYQSSSSSSTAVLNTNNPASATTTTSGSEAPPNSRTLVSISTDLRPMLLSIILTASFVTAKLTTRV